MVSDPDPAYIRLDPDPVFGSDLDPEFSGVGYGTEVFSRNGSRSSFLYSPGLDSDLDPGSG